MEIPELIDLTAKELVQRIEGSRGLAVFAKQRAKFEGWLKVELIDILLKGGIDNVLPEAGLTDVSFENVAIELKTVNTSYGNTYAERKTRPITMNVNSVIKDIENHRKGKSAHKNKFVLFIVFPLEKGKQEWEQIHLKRINEALCNDCTPHPFYFADLDGEISGCIYYGKVGEKPLQEITI